MFMLASFRFASCPFVRDHDDDDVDRDPSGGSALDIVIVFDFN